MHTRRTAPDTRYTSDHGARLVILGSDRNLGRDIRITDVRARLARSRGECSSCEAAAHPDSLDASGRCFTCQP
jgi:hypothetical protein